MKAVHVFLAHLLPALQHSSSPPTPCQEEDRKNENLGATADKRKMVFEIVEEMTKLRSEGEEKGELRIPESEKHSPEISRQLYNSVKTILICLNRRLLARYFISSDEIFSTVMSDNNNDISTTSQFDCSAVRNQVNFETDNFWETLLF